MTPTSDGATLRNDSAGMRALREFGLVVHSHRSAACIIAIVTAVVAVYGRTVQGYFMGDDFANVAVFSKYPFSSWPKLFVSDVSLGIWGPGPRPALRPFAALLGMVESRIFGGNAVPYRLLNLAIHVGNACLVFALARRLLPTGRALALGAALLFVVHPTHVEAVAWLAGRSDLLPTTFFLGALLAFIRFRQHGHTADLVWCFACGAVAIFTKENTVVLPLLFFAYDMLYHYGAPWRQPYPVWLRRAIPYLVYLLLLLIYTVLRRAAFGAGGGLPKRNEILGTIISNAPGRYLEYLSYLLAPLDTVFATPIALKLALAVTATLGLSALVLATRAPRDGLWRPLAFCGAAWLLITALPFLPTYPSARHLYGVAAGFCMFLAAFVRLATSEKRVLLRVLIFVVIGGTWTYVTLQELKPWIRAGRATRAVHRSIERLAGTPAGTPLILALPPNVASAISHAWSSPFLLDDPFFSPPRTGHFITLEPPDNYYRPDRWGSHPAIQQLVELNGNTDAYLLTLGSDERVETRKIKVERLKSAAAELRDEVAAKPVPPFHPHWDSFAQKLR